MAITNQNEIKSRMPMKPQQENPHQVPSGGVEAASPPLIPLQGPYHYANQESYYYYPYSRPYSNPYDGQYPYSYPPYPTYSPYGVY